jgi:redox-sensitive bicupin YhaK (pirin superfamily)
MGSTMPATLAPPRLTRLRGIACRTRGVRHGPITRLMSPGDLGDRVKPFVFLDLFEMDSVAGKGFAPHPHSGIATLTTMLAGGSTYADTSGKSGVLSAGAVEWMRAGGGVWHTGSPVAGQAVRGYQLWLALPPELELAPAESLYLDAEQVPGDGPFRVVLGDYMGLSSAIPLPVPITYLHVRLTDGEAWSYQPGADHDIAWLALNSGRLHTAGAVLEREMAVFAQGGGAIDLVAEGEVEMVIGSAAKHPHPLVTGYYSVHTSRPALRQGERTIAEMEKGPAVAALRRKG